MNLKEGRGNKPNSMYWKVFCDSERQLYTASLSLGSDMGCCYSLYEIDKMIFQRAGTFEADDYKTETLIKQGKLLYQYSNERWAKPVVTVVDEKYKEKCKWYFE